jgi:putative FmdB family regulatory protein
MPIYEYECVQCGHRFEQLVLKSTPAPECPSCQKTDLKQLVSLCAMSSEAIRDANFSSAQKKASARYKEKQHAEHEHLHEHFEDAKH